MNKNHSVISSDLKPQLLFSIPNPPNMKENVLENNLQFSFPNGIDISYYEEHPKIYPIRFTDKESNSYYYYILFFYEKVNDNMLGSKTSLIRNSDVNVTDIYYCPISIIICSDYGNFDFFRGLLINFYKIIKFDRSYINYNNSNSNFNINNIIMNGNKPEKNPSLNSIFEKEKILSFQKVELLNYFYFCYELPRPPNASIFTLNMRFDKIDYKLQSLLEIPTNEYCLDVLFNTLEISVIIKLFVALLFEKFIIILSNQNTPLFCICESLRYLIFPFELSFVYIPNLPFEKKDILESPVPYLIGINTSQISAEELIYPDRIVCEVGTSTLYGNTSKLKLPLNEEKKIKSKLILLRSKYKNNYDNVDTIDENDYDGIDFNLSFAQNVQNIFFSIFKDNLKNLKVYTKNNNFNSQKFLNSFKSEEYKLFFDIIIKTASFDIFIDSTGYLEDCHSRKFNNICRGNYMQKSKEKGESKNYYTYSFNIPKKLSKLFKISDFKQIYEEYNEISNLIIENPFRNRKSESNKNDIFKFSFKSLNDQYHYLNFYGKDGFILFASENKNAFNYGNIIKKEIIKLYKDLLKVYYDEENFLEYSNNLMLDIRQTITNSSYNRNNKKINYETNEGEIIVEAPIKSCCQIYILIAIFLYNTSDIKNTENKSMDLAKKTTNSSISTNNNFNKTNNEKLSHSNTINKNYDFLSKFKFSNYKFSLEHVICDNDKVHIDNIFIFKLFLFAFRKNRMEFPRNLFFKTLDRYSLEELKKIEDTRIKYIDKTIKCKIRELEKKTYKNPVIKLDSDLDDSDEDIRYNKMRKIIRNTNSNVNTIKRENSCINLNEINLLLNLEDNEKEQEKEKNIIKTKLNVVDSLTFSLIDKFYKNPELRDIYIQKKISEKKNSYNLDNFSNIPLLYRSMNDEVSLDKINPQLDPMLISEQICIKLYLYLSKVKIENFDAKTDNTSFLIDLAHSNEINEIKNLILDLKNISLENLSKNHIHYYCFWLNMYNFLTIFSIIYKCECFSNFHEWNRFIKNSYFTIGNIEISLLEIEAFILRDKSVLDKIYGSRKYDSQLNLPKIPKYDSIINFGISMVTKTSPSIRIYYPTNFYETLKFNMDEFFWRSIKIDLDKNELKIPEYLSWVEPNFVGNFDKYKNHLQEGCSQFIEENKNKLNSNIEKFYWKLSFANFKNNEIYLF